MKTIRNVLTHVRVLTFWAMVGFSLYGLHHFIQIVNGYSKVEMLWASIRLYMKWT